MQDVWDACDAWDNGFLKLALRASRFANGSARRCALRFADSEVGRVGQWFLEIGFEGFAQDLATPSAWSFAHESESQKAKQPARSFAHKIPHEITKASFMREALRHLLLENQMSHASHASHTSHPQATCKARSTSQPPTHPPTNNTKPRKETSNETENELCNYYAKSLFSSAERTLPCGLRGSSETKR